MPLQLLAHNYNSSVTWFIVCYLKILVRVLVFGTQFPFLCDFTIWLIDRLTNLPVLQSFLSSNSSAIYHLPLTIAPHGTRQEFTCICLSPLLAHFWLSSYCSAPLTSPFTFVAEREPLPLICSHERPVHPQAFRSMPCEPLSLLGHILEKSWILVDQVQGPGKLVHFSMALKTLSSARKASCLSPADSLMITPCASTPNTSQAINPHLSELS